MPGDLPREWIEYDPGGIMAKKMVCPPSESNRGRFGVVNPQRNTAKSLADAGVMPKYIGKLTPNH